MTATRTRSASASRLRALGGRRATLIKVAFAVMLIVWPLLHKSDYALNVMTSAGLYALLTIGVSLVIGQAGQLSFGHSAFYGIGAYTASLLVTRLHWPSVPALLAGAAASAIVALVVGRPVLRLRYFYLALATIGLGQIALVVVTQFRGVTGGWNGLAPIPEFSLFGRTADSYISKYYLVWIVALAVLLFTQRALKYRTGRSLRALATSEIAASTLGLRTANWKLLAFTVSAVICGVAGGLFAFTTGALTPDVFSFNAAVLPVIMMLLGGAETLWGGVLGAVVLTWLLNGFSGMAQYSCYCSCSFPTGWCRAWAARGGVVWLRGCGADRMGRPPAWAPTRRRNSSRRWMTNPVFLWRRPLPCPEPMRHPAREACSSPILRSSARPRAVNRSSSSTT
jgi:branched-chain amino acid transport system permease protein